jgi:hypothetical protein
MICFLNPVVNDVDAFSYLREYVRCDYRDGLDVFRCLVRQKESEIVKVACGHSSFIHGSDAIQISYVKTAPRKKIVSVPMGKTDK